jgi:hypothetical protein
MDRIGPDHARSSTRFTEPAVAANEFVRYAPLLPTVGRHNHTENREYAEGTEDMLPHQVVAVAIRLFALCLGISALRMLPSLLIVREGKPPGFAYAFFLFALTAVVSAFLWLFPSVVAGRLVSEHPGKGVPASADTWLAMGCALIGLWMLTYAVPALIRDVFVLRSAASDYSDTSNIKSWILYNLIEVAIALWLVFGAAGFRKLFWWARSAGVSKSLGE